MKKLVLYLACFLAALTVSRVRAQTIPFHDEIQGFKKQDSIRFPAKDAILFVGSSSFRMWKDVQSDFPHDTIINRGFGGSTLPDVTLYAHQVIVPYKPRQVIIYCGENDLASSDSVTASIVASRFKKLFSIIRKNLPAANITYISIKPSPSREHLMPKMKQANRLIRAFLKSRKNAAFVNIYPLMLLPGGKPRQDIFVEDKLHMNDKGYALWQKAIKPYLLKK